MNWHDLVRMFELLQGEPDEFKQNADEVYSKISNPDFMREILQTAIERDDNLNAVIREKDDNIERLTAESEGKDFYIKACGDLSSESIVMSREFIFEKLGYSTTFFDDTIYVLVYRLMKAEQELKIIKENARPLIQAMTDDMVKQYKNQTFYSPEMQESLLKLHDALMLMSMPLEEKEPKSGQQNASSESE